MGTRNRLNSQRLGKSWLASHQSAVFKPSHSQKKDSPPVTEDYRARFYEKYRKEAEEYDREFIMKYDEDLDTTLIFVSWGTPQTDTW